MSWNGGSWFKNGVWEIPRFTNIIRLYAAFEVHAFHAITFVPNEIAWVSLTDFPLETIMFDQKQEPARLYYIPRALPSRHFSYIVINRSSIK